MRSSNRLVRFCSAGTSRVAGGFSCRRGAIRRARARRRYGSAWLGSSLFFQSRCAQVVSWCVCVPCPCAYLDSGEYSYVVTFPLICLYIHFHADLSLFTFSPFRQLAIEALCEQACVEMTANWIYISLPHCLTRLARPLDMLPSSKMWPTAPKLLDLYQP
jgi:hypothetical protein